MNFFEQIKASIESFLGGLGETATTVILAILQILLIWIGAKVIIAILLAVIKKALKKKIAKHPDSLAAKKSETLLTMLSSIIKYTVYFFAVAGILGVLGLGATVGSLVATAGIGGIALGLGAQTFIKDVVSGFFLLFEDQFAVGDYIQAGNLTGTVEGISLRTTRLRLVNNEIATIPNGLIDIVVNYTRDNYLLFYQIAVAYGEDIAKAQNVLLATATEYAQSSKEVVNGPIPVGVVTVEPTRVTLRVNFYVKPLSQWQVERDMNLAVSQAFKENGIAVPDYDSCVIINNSTGA